jgi:hypothetical protein
MDGLFFSKYQKAPKPKRQTERGDLYDTILSRLNPDRAKKEFPLMAHSRLGYLLTNVPTKDLYALISKCDDAERRGYPWGAIFWNTKTQIGICRITASLVYNRRISDEGRGSRGAHSWKNWRDCGRLYSCARIRSS